MFRGCRNFVFFSIAFSLTAFNCYAADPYYYPPTSPGDDSWTTVSATSLGWDTNALNDAIAYADQQDSTAFIILHKGKIVSENYWDGWDLHTIGKIQSAHKTIAGLLFGIAQDESLVTRDEFVSSHLTNWSNATAPQEALVRIRHLQTMTSGMSGTLFPNAINYETAPDNEWRYNTTAYHLMRDIIGLQNPNGDYDQFIQSRLYDPIGMNDSIAFNGVIAQTSENSARDMARFGLMMLGNGTWDGIDVIQDKAYLAEMSVPSQAFNEAYGNLTWLNGQGSYIEAGSQTVISGELIPAAPADLFAALGAGDKKIYVVPSLDLVVVRHGPAAPAGGGLGPSGFDDSLWEKLCLAMNDCMAGDTIPPGEVTALTALEDDAAVALSWSNPADPDFVGVRIRRDTGSAPTGPNDGTQVFEGAGTAFNDTGLTNGTTYYYSAFAFDGVPNYSSGVSTNGTPQSPGGTCTDWTEDFSLANGTIVDTGISAWSIDDSALTITSSTDYFEVRGSEFQSRDIDGEGVWMSEVIGTGGANFSVSVDIRETGRLEGTDYVSLRYKLDGGAEVEFAYYQNDFGSGGIVESTGILSSDDVQIVIRARNNGGYEVHYWDNVTLSCQ